MLTCTKCGNQVAAGRKFCNKCGTPMAAGVKASAAATAARPAPVAPAPAPAAAPRQARQPASAAVNSAIAPRVSGRSGLSIWWLIGPLAFFAFLSRKPIPILLVVIVAAALWRWKTQPLPANATPGMRRLQPFAPALLIVVVFVMLGGVMAAITLAILIFAISRVIRNPEGVIQSLEPWWQYQATIPQGWRKPLAFIVPGITGFLFGTSASGVEWAFTLISLSVGIAIAFLLLFTPPESMRRRTGT